ncbi:TetR/AcrR family transcriptional regulator [Sandaracinus amylolyticus]|uniref:TetR/AcrR family transcriptional regulator n=1 Tax=Sandaracinus amylolyticus TaxID=927083 RepID=UPI001F36E1CE|nr:TetR/AcrR family transcriptional regulator [Sandaracinus amylolyticus]UJR80559.1 TetR family transcriptional regulator [Sandaracinus amylolyticus]
MSDARTQRTTRALRDALLSLMVERGWEAVRVQDVCERAGIARSTFYTHFTDKEDLLLSGFDTLQRELRAHAQGRPLGWVRPLIEHVREGYWLATRRRVSALTRGRGGQIIRERVTRLVMELLDEDLGDQIAKGTEREIALRYLAGALVELLLVDRTTPKRASVAELEATYRKLTSAALRALISG